MKGWIITKLIYNFILKIKAINEQSWYFAPIIKIKN